jgi:transposase InsO family protein
LKRYGINQKTVAKWKKPSSTADLRTGLKEPMSTILPVKDEAIIVAFRRHGVMVARLMSDNGRACRSPAFRLLLAARGIRHNRTRTYTPHTNGKAKRFIQTSLREWA